MWVVTHSMVRNVGGVYKAGWFLNQSLDQRVIHKICKDNDLKNHAHIRLFVAHKLPNEVAPCLIAGAEVINNSGSSLVLLGIGLGLLGAAKRKFLV